MINQFQQYPPWREAIKQFLAESFAPGDLLSFDWLYNAFAISQPTDDTRLADARKAELQFLGQFKSFENELLKAHQVALANVKGEGYRIVPPSEQTQWAEGTGNAEVTRALKKYMSRLVYVDHAALSDQGRRENADAIARLGMLASMHKRAIQHKSVIIPPATDDETDVGE